MMLSLEERAVWEARVADQRSSGLSKRAWCEQHRVTQHQLVYWAKQFWGTEKTEGVCAFKPVQIAEQQSVSSEISIHLNGARIEVQRGFDQQTLSEVLRVVTSSC